MATRLRINNVKGAYNAMLVGDTSITLTAALPAAAVPVSGTSYLALTLDADSATEEIVWITGPASSGTTYPVSRAQEGTTAVGHAAGSYVHGPTAQDFDVNASTLRSLGAPIITQGAGVPAFAGRLANDLHYDSSSGRESVLTGVGGSTLTDAFNRAAIGTTSDTGQTYTKLGTGAFTLSGNTLLFSSSGFAGLFWNHGASSGIEMTVTGLLANSFDQINMLIGTAANGSGGWNLVVGTTSVSLSDPQGVTVLNQSSLTGQSNVLMKWTLSVSGKNWTIYKNDVSYASGVTASTGTLTGTYSGIQSNTSATGSYYDNLSIVLLGTLAWAPTEPIYMQAQLASGSVATGTHVLKPGLRVPGDSTLREVVLRCDTAPVGASITVQVERFNNGGSQGVIATVSVTTGQTVGSVSGLTAGCAKGDMLRFNITSVGSTTAGADLTVSLDFH